MRGSAGKQSITQQQFWQSLPLASKLLMVLALLEALTCTIGLAVHASKVWNI